KHCLSASVKRLKRKSRWILQQDNGPKHQLMNGLKMKVLPWSPQFEEGRSWEAAKESGRLRTNICHEEWVEIMIQKLLRGNPKRLELVIKAEGGHRDFRSILEGG
uniref:Uncharacterized protein n=1 Tax=Scophthalmus maximus TaxID=52904 RepID=A0A8D3BJ88_SCOMX